MQLETDKLANYDKSDQIDPQQVRAALFRTFDLYLDFFLTQPKYGNERVPSNDSNSLIRQLWLKEKKEIFLDAIERGAGKLEERLNTDSSLTIPSQPPLVHRSRKDDAIELEKTYSIKSDQIEWKLHPKSNNDKVKDRENQEEFIKWSQNFQASTKGVIHNSFPGIICEPELATYLLSEGLAEQRVFYTKTIESRAKFTDIVGALGGESVLQRLYPTFMDVYNQPIGNSGSIAEILKAVSHQPIEKRQSYFLTQILFKNPDILEHLDYFIEQMKSIQQWEDVLTNWIDPISQGSIQQKESQKTAVSITSLAAELIGSENPFSSLGSQPLFRPKTQLESVISLSKIVNRFKSNVIGLKYLAGQVYYLLNENGVNKSNLRLEMEKMGLSETTIQLAGNYLYIRIFDVLNKLSQDKNFLALDENPLNTEPRKHINYIFRLDKSADRQSITTRLITEAKARTVHQTPTNTDGQKSKERRQATLENLLHGSNPMKAGRILELSKKFGLYFDPESKTFKTRGVADVSDEKEAKELTKIFMISLMGPSGRLNTEVTVMLSRIVTQDLLPVVVKKFLDNNRKDDNVIIYNKETLLPTEEFMVQTFISMIRENATGNSKRAKTLANNLLDCATVIAAHQLLKNTSFNSFPSKLLTDFEIKEASQAGWRKIYELFTFYNIYPDIMKKLSTNPSRSSNRVIADRLKQLLWETGYHDSLRESDQPKREASLTLINTLKSSIKGLNYE